MIIGIDPGMTGGIAMLSDSGEFLGGQRMPLVVDGKRKLVDGGLLNDFVYNTRPVGMEGALKRIVIEAPNSMPGQGLQSTFNFGRMCGAVETWATSRACPVTMTTPGQWKKAMGLTKDKRASLDKAVLEFGPDPLWQVLANDGIAEAALIALWWQRQSMKN